MKEFEKWWHSGPSELKGFCSLDSLTKIGWRAALELVLGWLDYSSEHKEIKDKIHDELEGGGE